MAICNLFKKLTKETGNFLMFSQYTEDLIKASTSPEFYRVVPSKFYAINADYNKGAITKYGADLNVAIPMFFQNEFENGCALIRSKISTGSAVNKNWCLNLFWNTMVDKVLPKTGNKLSDIKYIGDINIQSYDKHDGIGYSEIYCFIPNNAKEEAWDVTVGPTNMTAIKPSRQYVEGYDSSTTLPDNWSVRLLGGESYVCDKSFIFNKSITQPKSNDFTFNTIVVCYDVETKAGKILTDIPMGIYFTGCADDLKKIKNEYTKYSSNDDIYGTGTSYGLRICSRFVVTPEADGIKNIDISIENTEYSAFCRVMSLMAETQNKMNEILNQLYKKDQAYNELYSIFINSRTNVPYVKNVGGIDYWFVNGRKVGQYRQEITISTDEKRYVFAELVDGVNITEASTSAMGRLVFDVNSATFLYEVESPTGDKLYYTKSTDDKLAGLKPEIGRIYMMYDYTAADQSNEKPETYMGVHEGLARLLRTEIKR